MLRFYFSFFCHVCVFDFDWYCLFLKISIVLSLISFLNRTCQLPQKHHSLFYEPVQENKSRKEITCLCWSKTSCFGKKKKSTTGALEIKTTRVISDQCAWATDIISLWSSDQREPLRRLGFVRLQKTHSGPKPKTWYSSFSGKNLSVTECRPDSLLAWILENVSWNILPVISTWALLD